MESQLGLKDLIDFIKRRKMVFALAFILIFPAVVAIALILPPIYLAETRIIRESQQVSEDYIRSTITSYAEERLDAATQQVMSRANLIKIINMYDLYPEMRAKKTMGEIVARMKSAIKLETMYAKVSSERTGRPVAINTAFKLSYEGKDPLRVQKVTNTLASLYVELEVLAREKRASATTTFFENELENLKEQIRVQEEKNRLYKEAHIGELPENYPNNERILDRLERNLDNIEGRIQTIEERKLFIEGQLATIDPLLPITTDEGKMAANPAERLKRLRLQLLSLQSTLSDQHPDIKRLQSEINNLEKQIGKSDEAAIKIKRLQELEEELAAAKGRLGPRHPDILRLEKEVGTLSQEVDNLEREKMKIEVSEEQPDNPTYINLKTQIFIADSEIKKLQKDREEIKRSVEDYRNRIERTPLVEKEYSELTRDYKGLRQKYDDISSKLMEARVAQGMEESQFSERFAIIDPAALPEKPYKPNRIAFIVLGFIFAIGAGIGLAVVQESLDHSIKSADELNQITGGNLFSVISMIETEEEKRLKRVKRIAWTVGVTGLIAVVLIAVNQYLIPLETLWMEIKHRVVSI